jgi:protein O-GlcNAc transferase
MFTDQNNPWLKLKTSPLDEAHWLTLAQTYADHGQRWQLAYVVRQLSRLRVVPEKEVLSSLSLSAWEGLDSVEAVLSKPALEDVSVRAQHLQAWLLKQPGDWLGWLYLARLLELWPAAEAQHVADALTKAQALEYIAGESVHFVGSWRLKSGHASGAVALLSQLVDLRPLRHGSMVHLGEALLRVGNTAAAEVAFSRASHSENSLVLSLLADVVYRHNYWQEAMDVLGKATALQPGNVALWLKLAGMQSQVYQLSECRSSLAQIFRLAPGQEQGLLLEIGLLGQLGDGAAYYKALEAHLQGEQRPNSRLLSSVLMTTLYQDNLKAEEIAQLHCRLSAPLEMVYTPEKRLKRRKLDSNAKLRVGYVTGDLHRQHPVNIFMLPLLQQQKASPLEVYIYHTGTMFDQYTASAQACADVWVEAAGWDDEALHRQIVRDGVDVLVDLSGHTASHRLGVFVMRSAPVQASFLGYPHSTGLRCMDYLIGDSVVSPEGHEHLFSEKIARLSGSVFCWAPVDDYPLPAQARSHDPVVFGSFNNLLKLSDRTIALWARVLHSVPKSVLLLKAPSLRNAEVSDRLLTLFARHGIGSERLVFRGPSELGAMMQEYGDIDIALDPLPYNGGTTTLQALWMGVPVVSLLGQNFASRMGASFLSVLGKSEWLAHDEDQYLQIAQDIARDVDAIRMGRQALRDLMQACALCDMAQYSRDFERLLTSMADDSVLV